MAEWAVANESWARANGDVCRIFDETAKSMGLSMCFADDSGHLPAYKRDPRGVFR